MEKLTLDFLLENFAHTHRGYGIYTMDIDEVQVQSLTGQEFVRIDTTKIIETPAPKSIYFRTDGMNMRVSELIDFFGDDDPKVKHVPILYRTTSKGVFQV